uniref:Chemokine interleukin-8-like domain-containing protein n=1 Tax=Xenopus tropicalis TaxID=8364 RepID=A0A1B8Y8M7_XENTR|eukprot:XP_002940621.1 PREDICTED: C-X-C motif chemokine 10-like [Xenopus tropicalis]
MTPDKACVMIVGLLVILAYVHGMSPGGNRRCLCKRHVAKRFDLRSLKKVAVFPISPGCENVEIIATLKSGQHICIDPESKSINKLIFALKKKGYNKAIG